MNRRAFMKNTGALVSCAAFASSLIFLKSADADVDSQNTLVLNPYKNVDWDKCQQHKAALHIHTMQSDGHHCVDDVVNAYRNAGYTIMSITDHDTIKPNHHVVPNGRQLITKEDASPYPKDPKPENYPANTTWQWTDYGCSSPENLGMVGIEGNEFSFNHHINSYYNDCGWYGDMIDQDNKNWEDYEIERSSEKKGLLVVNHPGIPSSNWWERKPLDWYVDKFQKHSSDCLIGIEITNNKTVETEPYDIGLWDQLLARFMPYRPVWGFGNDDMHDLSVSMGVKQPGIKQTFNVFMLSGLNDANVRKAMESGQFVFCRSTRNIDYNPKRFAGFDIFPTIKSIDVDSDAGTITIEAENCDEIKWISSPQSLHTLEDYKKSNNPWQLGTIIHIGKTLDYKNASGIKNYVRVELHRYDGEHTQRTFTNPFGFSTI